MSIIAARGRGWLIGLIVGFALSAPGSHLFAQAALPPAIQPIPDQEMNYNPSGNIGYPQTLPVDVSNNPTTITATGLPPDVTFYTTNPYSGRGAAFVWQGGSEFGGNQGGEIPGGEFTVTITATNAAGADTKSFRWVIHPGIVGYITTDKSSYTTGETIHFRVQFSVPVLVTGTPYIALWAGRRANYVPGSGTDTLTFNYTIAPDDASLSSFHSGSVTLGDGTIKTPGGTTATLGEHSNIASTTPQFSVIALTTAGGRLVNLSTRGMVSDGPNAQAFIAGFVVAGSASKHVLLRATGPALTSFGIQNPLPNPSLQVMDATGRVMAQNDDWSGGDVALTMTAAGAFPLASGSRDAALVMTLNPGNYSMQVMANGGTGVALVEVYDLDTAAGSRSLLNVATRGNAGPDASALIAGFVVRDGPMRLLIRGVGPGLAPFGVPGTIADPMVKLYQGTTVIAQNDDWQIPSPGAATGAEIAAAAETVGAFGLPINSHDAALIVTLQAGAYTAVITPASGAGGGALIEVYELP